jgi:gamma-glutamylcyclotransferase (GGCT)/AIG2-like uncharacterized protein YtfP
MLYFAYGSNMNTPRMQARCPTAQPLSPAVLRGFRLVERLYADIEPAEGAEVHGVLWRLDEADLAALDRYEGFPRLYQRFVVAVEARTVLPSRLETTVPAVVYIMSTAAKQMRGAVSYTPEYWQICHEGARQHAVVQSPFWRPYAHTD